MVYRPAVICQPDSSTATIFRHGSHRQLIALHALQIVEGVGLALGTGGQDRGDYVRHVGVVLRFEEQRVLSGSHNQLDQPLDLIVIHRRVENSTKGTQPLEVPATIAASHQQSICAADWC